MPTSPTKSTVADKAHMSGMTSFSSLYSTSARSRLSTAKPMASSDGVSSTVMRPSPSLSTK